MTEPIKFDPAKHVIVPRVATDEQYRKADEAFWERKHSGRNVCYESIYKAMIAAAPTITINAPLVVTKAEAVEITTEQLQEVKEMTTGQIIYQTGRYSVRKAKHGYEVYEDGITYATRCAQIGYNGEIGLNKAIEEANRREKADNQSKT